MKAMRLLLLLPLSALAAPAGAQGVRGSVRATANYVQLAPIRQDTVARADVDEVDGRLEFDGHPVTCILVDRCTFFRQVEAVGGTALTEDVSVTAWGFGLEGLSATAIARTRQDLGGDFTVPRANDAFDLLLGYAELARERWRARVGRMRTIAGLGFSGYDGAALLARPLRGLNVEGYAGRSLAPGLEDTRDAALDPIETFVPDRDSWLLGAAVGYEPMHGTAFEVRYQRDLLGDRSVLLSERASFDARSDWLRPLAIELSADYDVALASWGKARLALAYPLTSTIDVQGTLRRYRPYFELWTIWGYFSPIAYHEAELDVSWSPDTDFHVQAGVGHRTYEEHHAPVIFHELADRSTSARVGAVWTRGDWTASMEYRVEGPVGAFMNGGDAELRWRPLDALRVGAFISATQQIMEYRLGNERIWGAGGSVEYAWHDRALITGGAALYAHGVNGRPTGGDWSQARAWAALEVGFGTEPALLDDVVPANPLPEDYWPVTEALEDDEEAESAPVATRDPEGTP